MEYAPEKRQILAIWRKLGYSMNSLDTRVKRAFEIPVSGLKDGALSLRYEGAHFSATAEVTLAWFLHASAWAKKYGHGQLLAHLSHHAKEIREALQ